MDHNCHSFWLVNITVLLLIFGVHGFEFQMTIDYSFDLDPSCIDPKTACKDAELPLKVYDPENCHQYYECITMSNTSIVPSNNPVPCPSGQYFDYDNQTCVKKIINSCTTACVNDNCPTECPKDENILIADEYDCGTFYVCFNGEKSAATFCDESAPYFNGIECSIYEYSCCNFCNIVCEAEGTEVRDPYDCRSYYLCQEEGPVDEDLHFECPEGTYFDFNAGYCLPETEPCISICNSTSLYSKLR